MDNAIQDLEDIKSQLKKAMRSKKPKMLVVDDEPDNLDLLYRTFRREFNVFKADSGVHALEILKEQGEVAVIISDQRMPEMKGTEFLSKTLSEFPNTVRIILTGFTDIEDLVEAINSGQVYKYITKPWDPKELKEVVQNAAQTYSLIRQRSEELLRAQAHTQLMAAILQVAQEANTPEDCPEPIAKAFAENFGADSAVLQLVAGETLATAGTYNPQQIDLSWLANDPLVEQARTQHQIKLSAKISRDKELSQLEHYQNTGIQAHLVVPIIYRETLLAILALQWQKAAPIKEEELDTIYLACQQVALTLNTVQNS